MRIYQDDGWVIERDSGEIVHLTQNESSLLKTTMEREELWEDLLFHIKDEEPYESKRDEIIAAKEDILDEMMWSDERAPIEKWVDLEDDDE